MQVLTQQLRKSHVIRGLQHQYETLRQLRKSQVTRRRRYAVTTTPIKQKDSSINIIDDLQNNIINRNCNCDDIGEVILNVNIRGLNALFNKLLVFIKSLVIKPCIIVFSETRNLNHPEFFNITGHKMYDNNGNIKQNDGLIVYISEYISQTTEIIDINNLKIINTKIAIENNKDIILSALYRSHDIKNIKTTLLWEILTLTF